MPAPFATFPRTVSNGPPKLPQNMPEVIGLLPMAGRASRLAPLPCSKEVYPVTLYHGPQGPRPVTVSEFLLQRMRHSGIRQAILVIRDGKWDIPAYYNDGTALVDMHIAYVLARLPHGPAFSLDAAHPFIRHNLVAMGFPDILFSPADAFTHLLERQAATQADIMLGLFPMAQNRTDDAVDFDPQGRVRQLHVQQRVTGLEFTWTIAIWTPQFTRFLHNYLEAQLQISNPPPHEIIVGHVVREAVRAGLVVQAMPFADGRCLDIGTPDGLARLPEFISKLQVSERRPGCGL